jgi:preprotein translocase subunit SecE
MSADKTLGEKPERRRLVLGRARKDDAEAQEEARAVAGKAKATPSRRERDEEEDEKPKGLAGIWHGLREYFEGVQSELKKVIWPTREDTTRLTRIVLIMLVLSALALGAIVLLFTELFRIGLNNPIILIVVMAVAGVAGVLLARYNSRSQA